MPRDAVSRTAHVGTVGKNGISRARYPVVTMIGPHLARFGNVDSVWERRKSSLINIFCWKVMNDCLFVTEHRWISIIHCWINDQLLKDYITYLILHFMKVCQSVDDSYDRSITVIKRDLESLKAFDWLVTIQSWWWIAPKSSIYKELSCMYKDVCLCMYKCHLCITVWDR